MDVRPKLDDFQAREDGTSRTALSKHADDRTDTLTRVNGSRAVKSSSRLDQARCSIDA